MAYEYVVIITGGASGIGAACARVFAKRSWKVIIADLNQTMGDALVQSISQSGGQALFTKLDVSNEQSVTEGIQAGIKAFGHIDAAVNCAGIGGAPSPIGAYPLAEFQRVLNVDLIGCFIFSKALVAYWLQQPARTLRHDTDLNLDPVTQRGALVNIASVAGVGAIAQMGAYVAAKHGVNGLTKNIAVENAEHGIRANAVCPGITLTPIMIEEGGVDIEVVKEIYLKNEPAMKRFSHPEEIANVCYFLCSDDASFVTGSVITADGGWTSH